MEDDLFDLKTLVRPKTPEEAVGAFLETEGTGLYVAGGSIIIPTGSPSLDYLVDLTSLSLDYIRSDGADGAPVLAIGATTRIADLIDAPGLERPGWAAISDAARHVANHTVRNRATVGGNIFAAHYPSDLPPVFLALGADVVLHGKSGPRTVPLRDFYGRRAEVYSRGDIITEVRIPAGARGTACAFIKLGRTRVDVAVVNCAVALTSTGGVVKEARIALNGLAAVPVLADEAGDLLKGRTLDAETISETARVVEESVSPRSDHRASSGYRLRMAGVVVRRALERCKDSSG